MEFHFNNIKMKKITVITGKASSGKSFLSESLSLIYEKPYFLDLRSFNKKNIDLKYYLKFLNENTDLIVIDDLQQNINLESLIFELSNDYIEVHKRGKNPFKIKTPKVIINLDENYKLNNISLSALRRINIIECVKEDNIFDFKKHV